MTVLRAARLALIIGLLSGCGQSDETAASAAPEGGSVTLWTATSELFMEYPALIVGKDTRFAVHLTWLADFTPVTEGALTLRLKSSAGGEVTGTAEKPTSPGIYRPTIIFDQPGTYRLELIINGRSTDTLRVESLEVYASLTDVPKEPESSAGEQLIVFLKEQQWKTDFMTSAVERKNITGTVRAACEIVPGQGNEALVSAPFTGIVPADGDRTFPTVGQVVKAQEVLAVMTPSAETAGGIENFASRFIEARSDLELAGKEFERSKKLFASGLVSEKEYQEAEVDFKEADATYRTLSTFAHSSEDGQAITTFALRAPIAGTIVDVNVVPGKHVDAGEAMYHIVDASSVWVRANVASPEIGKLSRPDRAWVQVAGVGDLIEVNDRNGRLISVATAIDPSTRTFPVIFQVANPDGRLRIGMFGEMSIVTSRARKSIVVPESALQEDEGRYSVYIQAEGEAFVRRDVTIGERNGEVVEIMSGITEGERVVTVGAYQVRLASLSAQLPAHGHEH